MIEKGTFHDEEEKTFLFEYDGTLDESATICLALYDKDNYLVLGKDPTIKFDNKNTLSNNRLLLIDKSTVHEHSILTPATLREGAKCECGEVMSNCLGDVNSSGDKANLRDVVLLYQHCSKWNVTLDLTVADVNRDSNISLRDVVMLYQFCSGWNV